SSPRARRRSVLRHGRCAASTRSSCPDARRRSARPTSPGPRAWHPRSRPALRAAFRVARPPRRRDSLREGAQPPDEQLEEAVRGNVDADVRVRLAPTPAPDVDDGPAATELRLDVDLRVQVLRPDEIVADDVGDCDRVVDRGAVEVVDLLVELAVE